MKAITIRAPGGPEVLTITQVVRPVPAPDEVLVRVHASGVNRADVLQRRGGYAAPLGVAQHIPGLEFAGVVEEVGGPQVQTRVGDRVMGIVAGGGYAEYLVLPAEQACPIPASLSFVEAAAVPEAFVTAHDALVFRAGLRSGERVLIHAVGSGVGLAILQLAKAAGATVAGTSRTESKLERARVYGLDRAILANGPFYPSEDLRDWADVIGDLVGGAYLHGNLVAAALRGRIVVIGLTGGRSAQIDLGQLLGKRLTLVGTVLRSRSRGEKTALARSFVREVLPMFDDGPLQPVLDRVFPASAASEAHRYMEENRNFGAIVLDWNASPP